MLSLGIYKDVRARLSRSIFYLHIIRATTVLSSKHLVVTGILLLFPGCSLPSLSFRIFAELLALKLS